MTFRERWARLRGTIRREGLEGEMNREMQFHLDMAAQRNAERGMRPEMAKREAQLAFGSTEQFKESGREAYRARTAENVAADVRFALRSMRRAPAFAVAAIVTVALGIGASTAMFTVVNAVLLRPLPIPEPDDFVYVGAWTLVVLAVLTLLTIGVDFWATMFGAKKFGASRRAVIGAVMGSIAGLFLGLPGVLFGPFIGAVIGEISSRGSLSEATRAGFGATLGLILGAAIKLALALSMIGIFVAVRFVH